MPAEQPPNGVDSACQLELFDGTLAEPQRAGTEPLASNDRRDGSNADWEVLPTTLAESSTASGRRTYCDADRAVLKALEVALADARAAADDRPALIVLASYLGVLGAPTTPPPDDRVSLRQAGDDWLRRLETQQKSESTLVGYRVAIDDLLAWSETNGPDILTEAAIVEYLHSYQERAQPADASYYRRFVLLRKFMRWVCRRDGVPDPFLDLDAPPKPRQERDWLTPEEFRRLLDAASRPERNLPGLAERDQLVLIALVTTGLRRSELCALEWRDLELDGRKQSLLVRYGKGGKARRQPLPARLSLELRKLRDARQPEPTDPVFCGLVGGRLQETILADIIRRAAQRAGIEKHVTAHTLRHTAATWLRQELGDTRLVAEYLGHADLSTVARYAHVDRDELFDAAGRLEQLAAPSEERAAPDAPAEPGDSHDLPSGSDQPRRRRRRQRRRRRR
ncbi:MAG: tyrosine-type recombinase/integrase [Actinomycetota bacterium]|nr:tyrosine-type recombinase/integrase [Actinomycetota bacterium]